jgi:hypothetical protein
VFHSSPKLTWHSWKQGYKTPVVISLIQLIKIINLPRHRSSSLGAYDFNYLSILEIIVCSFYMIDVCDSSYLSLLERIVYSFYDIVMK